jgi:hypothetical protein
MTVAESILSETDLFKNYISAKNGYDEKNLVRSKKRSLAISANFAELEKAL